MLESVKNGRHKIRPISFSQQQLWLFDQLDPGNPTYNIARAIRARGPLSGEALRESLQAIVARHESLRTTFAEIEEEPVQVIAAGCSLEFPTIDLSDVPKSKRESEALRLARDEAQRSFDLTSGPLMRATLLRLGADEHILVLVMHHIITDGWSMGVLFKELGQLYEACAAGLPSPLPDLPIQYGDFAVWQRKSLKGEVLDRHLAYWRSQLAGADPVLEIPTDRARPAARTPHGGTQRVLFSSALRERLKAVGREANATLFMTLLAAFQVLLWRYTNRDDLLVGSPTAGRNEIELEDLVGFFVNTVVIRTDLSGNPPFRELVRRVRDVALEAHEHQDAPLVKVMEALQVPRSLSYSPLFQVMFILQNVPRQGLEFAGLTLEELEFDSGTAKFDLTVEMAEEDDGLSCAFEYSTDILQPATVARMLGHFRSLLEGIAADPDRRLSVLPLMTEAERHRLLAEWNDTAADYPRDQCIHELFEAQAERTPTAVALVCRDRRVTYRELNARANQLAHHLRRRGVGPGVLVGICVERSVEAVAGLLGILKAGGAYVPMDPAYPPQRLRFMLEDSRAPVLLTTPGLMERVPGTACEIFHLDRDWASVAHESDANPDSRVGPQDLAYVMYTSGSTGTPKGVLASHRASVNRFAWMWKQWAFAPGEVCCQKTALSFVDSVWEIFGPLLQGIRTVIIPDEDLENPDRMVQTLAANRVTRIVLVPSVLALLLDGVPDLRGRAPELRFWITSGEAITPELARRFEERLPEATLINLYGSSEVAADVTWYHIRSSRSLDRIPIGRPIANTQIYVLDHELNPVPIGVPGEIHVGGHSLARGYLNNPELTSQKFISDPFASDSQARLYKTGDLGRLLSDGNLEFLGRVDNQVKIRGVRIELGEIESVLRTHPSVRAAVVTVSGSGGDERLTGYVVVNDPPPDQSDLRRFLRAKLPDNMVPAWFLALDALPLLPNGKVNRRALPPPDEASRERGRAYVAPRNDMEYRLAGIMAEVLNLERMGVDDNFFELGGHSLRGIQVIARVRKVFQVELPLRTLFEEPTVAGLCLEIEKARKRDPGTAISSPARRITLSPREQLLARLKQLSDLELEALLNSMPGKNRDERETGEP
jgi:amino acid adenylation domain-containing protein